MPGPRGLPLFKPPYSSITAYDMNRGEKLWSIPHGDGPRDNPALRDLKLPPLGSLEKPGGPLLTKTLLFIGQGLVSSKFRAFDKKTGETLWDFDLPAKSSAAPITYLLDGKQYISWRSAAGISRTSSWRSRCRNGQSEDAGPECRRVVVRRVCAPPRQTDCAGSSRDCLGPRIQRRAGRSRRRYLNRTCSSCHRSDRTGGDDGAPALRGDPFFSRWKDRSLADFYFVLAETMPQDAPSSLSRKEYADIISFILKEKVDAPAGDAELVPDEERLKHIVFTGSGALIEPRRCSRCV